LCAQCTQTINNFPYQQSFETSGGGWTSGGAGSTWAWGSPSKAVINRAGDGTRCWMAGGLTTGTTYSDGEQSWLQSPCFDFTNIEFPLLAMKLFWETEQQWDGASFQYSLDNGATWSTAGVANEKQDCFNKNWFNTPGINGLNGMPGTSGSTHGWTGNNQSNNGSCKGGGGSKTWVQAGRTLPSLGGEPSVMFRFIFGAGTTCNNYDGFAVDSINISNAPPNAASFRYVCNPNRTISFINTSPYCPSSFRWEFDDPLSSANNNSNLPNPSHTYAFPGDYTVTLTIDGPGNQFSTTTRDIIIADVTVAQVKPAFCETNTGGSLAATVRGAGATTLSYTWTTIPAQTSPVASNLGVGTYTVTVTGQDICTASAAGTITLDSSCRELMFPTAFTPNDDGLNDRFGPLGSVAAVKQYRLLVYNRWGQLVFKSNNASEGWDGRVAGKMGDSALFTWYCEYQLPGQNKSSKKGTLTLIR
jgi:gliding motility-associated-like protein